MTAIPDRPISDGEVADLQRPLVNDLLAYYRLVEDAADDLLIKAIEEGWTPDQFIDEVSRLVAGDTRAPETVAVPSGSEITVKKARALEGKLEFQELPVSVENAKGSIRSGVDPDGHPWATTMLSPYGYIRGTEGVDGDAVDVFVGDNPLSQLVFVAHIKKPDGTYDEDKCLIGYNSEDEARKVIENHYDRDILQGMETLTLGQFRQRLEAKPGQKITAPRPRAAVLKDLRANLALLRDIKAVQKADEFKEGDHPRDEGGKFTSGSSANSEEKDYTQGKEQSHGKRDQEGRGAAENGADRRGATSGAVADIRSQGRERYTSRNVDYGAEGGLDLKKIQDFNARAGLPAGAKSVKTISEHSDGTVTYELDPEVCNQHYHDTLAALRQKSPEGAQVSLKDPEAYKSMRLFSADDSSAVIALDGTDLVSVCASKRADGTSAARSLIWQAVGEGVETADCYGTYLPKFYAQFGFQPVARLGWNQDVWDEYAAGEKGRMSPEQLDSQKMFANWNGGKPDYIFLKLTGDTSMPDLKAVPMADDWDAGVAAQRDVKKSLHVAKRDDFKETEHPRDKSGQFTSGSGVSGGGAKTQTAQPKKAKVEDLPSKKPAEMKQPSRNLDEVYGLVDGAREHFTTFADGIAKKYGADVLSRKTLKSRERVAQKLQEDPDKGPDEIVDIDAKTIVAPDVESLHGIYQDLLNDENVVRAKNRFSNPTDAGYRDILTNVKMPNGAIVELQVSTPQMLNAKKVAHTLYEVERELDLAIVSGKGGKEAREAKQDLSDIQKKVYSAAWEASLRNDASFSASSLLMSEAQWLKSVKTKLGRGFNDLSENTRKHFSELLSPAYGMPSESKNTRSGESIEKSFMGSTSAFSIYDGGTIYKSFRTQKAEKKGGAAMPVPSPKKGETESDFVSRVIGELVSSGKPQDQAAAIAYDAFRSARKAQTRNPVQEFIDNARSLGVDPAEFYAGILAESKEHEGDYAEGAKIALDHLRKEDPEYYTKLREAGL